MANIVVCPEPLAAEAGAQIFEKGGNAVDAMVAASIAQGVVNPLLCGIGGTGWVHLWWESENRDVSIETDTGIPSKARPDSFEYYWDDDGMLKVLNNENSVGYKASIAPDFLKVLFDTHEHYGRLEWYDCLQPAINLARNGFRIYPYVERWIAGMAIQRAQASTITKSAADIFTKNGEPYKRGDLFIQSDYAHTLEKVAENGVDIFYKGEIADIIAEDFEKHHGFITRKDLEGIETKFRDPYRTNYNEYTISTDRIPGMGLMLIEMMNILEGFDLKELRWNSPKYLDTLVRTMNISLADRFRYSRDPNFFPEAEKNVSRIMSKDHASKMIEMIKSGEDNALPSSLDILRSSIERSGVVYNNPSHHGTTDLDVIDSDGNVASITHSSVSGSGVVTPGLGFIWNSYMGGIWRYQIVNDQYDIRPGKRHLGGGGPGFVFKDGKFVMVTGSPKGYYGYIGQMEAMIHVLNFNMDMQQAVSAPRIDGVGYEKDVHLEYNFPYPYPWKNLESLGHKITIVYHTSRVGGILKNLKTGDVEGGTDPRGGAGLAIVR